ncbi:MAG: porin family protein [Gemmatimonadota bacterium]
MRKLVISLVVILLSMPAAGLAQTPSFGLRGGLNMAGFGGSRIVSSDARAGFTFGAFVAIPMRAAVAIQPEVVFSRRGAKRAAYDYDAFPQDGDAPPLGVYLSEKTSHDYLEVPVLLKLSPSARGDFVRPILFAGPSVGFLLGAKEVYDTDYAEHLKSMDFGVIIGGGMELGRLSVDARYNLGLAAIDKDYEASFGHVAGDVKNRAFTVSAGLRLF